METKQRSYTLHKVQYEDMRVDMFYLKLAINKESILQGRMLTRNWDALSKLESENMDFYIVLN